MMSEREGVLDTHDGDRLPWLEAVEDEAEQQGTGVGKLVAGVLIALVVIGLVIGGVFWSREKGPAAGEPGLIAAPDGAYKVPPDAPGGMEVAGRGDSSYAASEGADPNAAIDLSALPETPVTSSPVTSADAAAAPRPTKPTPTASAKIEDKGEKLAAAAPPKPAPVPVARPQPKPAAPVAAPAPAPALGSGGTVQLGAFSSEAKATAAWKSLSGRFGFLSALPQSVTPVTTGSGTLYRLRAGAGGQASTLCSRLRVAGESCAVVN